MTFVSTRFGAAVVFRLNGVFGAGVDFSALHAAIGQLAGDPTRAVFLDMAHITTLDCIGIGELIRLRNRVDAAGCTFGLVNLDARQQKLLDLARLSAVLGVRHLGDGAMTRAAFDFPIRKSGRPFSQVLAKPRKLGVSRRARLAVV